MSFYLFIYLLISKSYVVYGSLYTGFGLIQIGFGLPFKVEALALPGEVKNMSIQVFYYTQTS